MFFLFKFLQILSCRQELIKAPLIAGINPLKMKKLSNSELPKRSYNTINFSCSSFLVNVSPLYTLRLFGKVYTQKYILLITKHPLSMVVVLCDGHWHSDLEVLRDSQKPKKDIKIKVR